MFELFASFWHKENEIDKPVKANTEKPLTNGSVPFKSGTRMQQECFAYIYPPKPHEHINLQDYFDGKKDTSYKLRAQRIPGAPLTVSCSIYPSQEKLLQFLTSQNSLPSDETYILRLGFDSDTVAKLIEQGNFHLAIAAAYPLADVYRNKIENINEPVRKTMNSSFSTELPPDYVTKINGP